MYQGAKWYQYDIEGDQDPTVRTMDLATCSKAKPQSIFLNRLAPQQTHLNSSKLKKNSMGFQIDMLCATDEIDSILEYLKAWPNPHNPPSPPSRNIFEFP